MAVNISFKSTLDALESDMRKSERKWTYAMKTAMTEALKHTRGGVSFRLKGVFPAKVLKRRLLERLTGTTGSVFVGLNPVDLAYLNPYQSNRGIKANGVYYAGAFFKKNSTHKSVWMRKFSSRKDVDWDEYLKLYKVVQEIPADMVHEVLENALDDMQAYFLKRYEHHLRRFDLIE
jgi:hypothetical protein